MVFFEKNILAPIFYEKNILALSYNKKNILALAANRYTVDPVLRGPCINRPPSH